MVIGPQLDDVIRTEKPAERGIEGFLLITEVRAGEPCDFDEGHGDLALQPSCERAAEL